MSGPTDVVVSNFEINKTRGIFSYMRRAPTHVGTCRRSGHAGVHFDANRNIHCRTSMYSHRFFDVLMLLIQVPGSVD
jgi:hypothetical protein